MLQSGFEAFYAGHVFKADFQSWNASVRVMHILFMQVIHIWLSSYFNRFSPMLLLLWFFALAGYPLGVGPFKITVAQRKHLS